MNARLAFHVGVHKTGSSSIQTFLRDRTPQLREQGITYLSRTVLEALISRGDVELNDWDGLAAAVGRAVRVDDTELVITSHEGTMGPAFPGENRGLYSRAPVLAPRLADTLAGDDPTIVVAVRPQADFLESYYLQSIHTGRHQPFDAWLARLDLDRLSWRPLVDSLVTAFGAEHVRIMDFRTIRQGQQNYISDFLAHAAPGRVVSVDYNAARNPSISAKGLSLALAVNPLLRTVPERKSMRRFLQTHFSNLDYPRSVLVSDKLRSQLGERYDAEYDELAGV